MSYTKTMHAALVVSIGLLSTPALAQNVLNVSVWVPRAHLLASEVTVPLCNEIKQVTTGRVECNILPKAVASPPQTFGAIKNGLADLSFIVHGYTLGKFKLNHLVELPFTGDSAETISVAYQRVYEKLLAKHNEHEGVHVLGVFSHGPGQVFTTSKPIASITDLSGMKVRVGGGMINNVLEAVGAVPIFKPAPETYELLSQGVIDGVAAEKGTITAFKFVPLIKHGTYFPGGLYNVSFAAVVNRAKWLTISETDRAAIQQIAGEALARRAGRAWDAADAGADRAMRAAGIMITEADAKFLADLKSKSSSIEDAWIKEVKGMGLDGALARKMLREEIAAVSGK